MAWFEHLSDLAAIGTDTSGRDSSRSTSSGKREFRRRPLSLARNNPAETVSVSKLRIPVKAATDYGEKADSITVMADTPLPSTAAGISGGGLFVKS